MKWEKNSLQCVSCPLQGDQDHAARWHGPHKAMPREQGTNERGRRDVRDTRGKERWTPASRTLWTVDHSPILPSWHLSLHCAAQFRARTVEPRRSPGNEPVSSHAPALTAKMHGAWALNISCFIWFRQFGCWCNKIINFAVVLQWFDEIWRLDSNTDNHSLADQWIIRHHQPEDSNSRRF